MAKNEELEVEESGEKKGKGKLIIIIAAAALLCIGIGAGSVFFLVGDSDESVSEEELVPQHVQATYHRFDEPFIVTVTSGGKQRYLQVNVTVKTKEQGVIKLLQAHGPVVKSALNNLFSAQDLNYMQSAQGRMDLNKEALAVVQAFITSKNEALTVEKVLFTDFVMQ